MCSGRDRDTNREMACEADRQGSSPAVAGMTARRDLEEGSCMGRGTVQEGRAVDSNLPEGEEELRWRCSSRLEAGSRTVKELEGTVGKDPQADGHSTLRLKAVQQEVGRMHRLDSSPALRRPHTILAELLLPAPRDGSPQPVQEAGRGVGSALDVGKCLEQRLPRASRAASSRCPYRALRARPASRTSRRAGYSELEEEAGGVSISRQHRSLTSALTALVRCKMARQTSAVSGVWKKDSVKVRLHLVAILITRRGDPTCTLSTHACSPGTGCGRVCGYRKPARRGGWSAGGRCRVPVVGDYRGAFLPLTRRISCTYWTRMRAGEHEVYAACAADTAKGGGRRPGSQGPQPRTALGLRVVVADAVQEDCHGDRDGVPCGGRGGRPEQGHQDGDSQCTEGHQLHRCVASPSPLGSAQLTVFLCSPLARYRGRSASNQGEPDAARPVVRRSNRLLLKADPCPFCRTRTLRTETRIHRSHPLRSISRRPTPLRRHSSRQARPVARAATLLYPACRRTRRGHSRSDGVELGGQGGGAGKCPARPGFASACAVPHRLGRRAGESARQFPQFSAQTNLSSLLRSPTTSTTCQHSSAHSTSSTRCSKTRRSSSSHTFTSSLRPSSPASLPPPSLPSLPTPTLPHPPSAPSPLRSSTSSSNVTPTLTLLSSRA